MTSKDYNDPELALQFAVQRYIYDWMELGNKVGSEIEIGWENLSMSKYVAHRLIEHGWIKND